jgi:hypothetical protein
VNGSTNAVVAQGAVLAIAVANAPGNRTDWVGLAVDGSPDTAIISYAYLGGLQSPPNVVMTSAAFAMIAPSTDGSYQARLYASNGWTVLARAKFTVQGTAQPVITVTPNIPEIPDTTPLGGVVATYAVTMSDGSPFTGSVRFGAPFFDAGGVFALSSNRIIVNPVGPGVGSNMGTITDHITLEAIP